MITLKLQNPEDSSIIKEYRGNLRIEFIKKNPVMIPDSFHTYFMIGVKTRFL